MTPHPALQAWIGEALSTIGAAATPLVVSKHVWARHGDELEAAGDLLFTWQLDLRAAAAAMAADGMIEIGDDTWALRPGALPSPPVRPRTWSSTDIEVVVDGYLSMLRAAADGRPAGRSAVIANLEEKTGRTGPPLDGLLANVSAVVQELGLEPLPTYPPRSNVPVGVRPAVRAALGLP